MSKMKQKGRVYAKTSAALIVAMLMLIGSDRENSPFQPR